MYANILMKTDSCSTVVFRRTNKCFSFTNATKNLTPCRYQVYWNRYNFWSDSRKSWENLAASFSVMATSSGFQCNRFQPQVPRWSALHFLTERKLLTRIEEVVTAWITTDPSLALPCMLGDGSLATATHQASCSSGELQCFSLTLYIIQHKKQ